MLTVSELGCKLWHVGLLDASSVRPQHGLNLDSQLHKFLRMSTLKGVFTSLSVSLISLFISLSLSDTEGPQRSIIRRV